MSQGQMEPEEREQLDRWEAAHERIKVLADLFLTCWNSLDTGHKAIRALGVHVATLHLALRRAGVLSEDQLEDAKKEVEAGIEVERALDPEHQAALEELSRLVEELRRPDEQDKQ